MFDRVSLIGLALSRDLCDVTCVQDFNDSYSMRFITLVYVTLRVDLHVFYSIKHQWLQSCLESSNMKGGSLQYEMMHVIVGWLGVFRSPTNVFHDIGLIRRNFELQISA